MSVRNYEFRTTIGILWLLTLVSFLVMGHYGSMRVSIIGIAVASFVCLFGVLEAE